MADDAVATGAKHHLPRRTIARYAIGSVGTGGFSTLPGLVLLYYLTDSLGVVAWLAGSIVTTVKIWDVLIDPVIGALSDRSLARTGSRRRVMRLGALSLPLFFVLTFAVPPALAPALAAVWVLLAFGFASTSFSLFQVPYIALPAELTGDYDERSRLMSWRVAVLSLAILAFGAGGPALRAIGSPQTGYLVMALVCGSVIGVCLWISARVAPSRGKQPTTATPASGGNVSLAAGFAAGVGALRRSQPFRVLLGVFLLQAVATGAMLAAANYVAVWVMHSEAALTFLFAALIAPAIACAPAWARLADRVGKERSLVYASVIFAVAGGSLGLAALSPGAWMYLSVAAAGAAYAGMQVLPLAMLPDVISHDAQVHGAGRAGVFGGVWTAGETTGMALGAAVLTVVLSVTGYLESVSGQEVTQPEAAVTGIALSFSVLPAILVLASLVLLMRYRLRRDDLTEGVRA